MLHSHKPNIIQSFLFFLIKQLHKNESYFTSYGKIIDPNSRIPNYHHSLPQAQNGRHYVDDIFNLVSLRHNVLNFK